MDHGQNHLSISAVAILSKWNLLHSEVYLLFRTKSQQLVKRLDPLLYPPVGKLIQLRYSMPKKSTAKSLRLDDNELLDKCLQQVNFTLYSCLNVLYSEIIIYINGPINCPLYIGPIYNCYTIEYDSQHTHTHTHTHTHKFKSHFTHENICRDSSSDT